MLTETHRWFVDWCQPIIKAMYHRDKQAVKDTVGKAHAALDSGKVSEAEGACLGYQLAYLEFQAQSVIKNPQWRESVLPQLIAILARPSEVSVAERVRRRLYIQVRITLDRVEVDQLSFDVFEQLLKGIPEEDHSAEMWHQIADWAFRHNHSNVLENAYGFMVFRAKGFNEIWCWHRVNIMLKIARGEATERDIIWLIDQAQIVAHLKSLHALILPRAEAMGAVGKTAKRHLQIRISDLQNNGDGKMDSYLGSHIK